MRSPRALALVTLFGCAACHDRPTAPPEAPAPSAARSAAPRLSAAPAAASALDPAASAHEPVASASAATGAARPWPPPAPGVRTEWCDEGLGALDEATCYVLPAARPSELLIYLHGIVPPGQASAQKANLQTVVANAARRAGVAALVPRGEQGLGPPGQEQWWGWPTGEASYRRRGPAMVRALGEARERFERFAGVTFTRVYVAGSSSGAYFVSELALRGGLRADGFAAISGGAGRPTAELAAVAPTPFYVGHSTHESGASARTLAELLRRAGWPVRVAAHPVPHGAHEAYLDEAFSFWRERAAGPGVGATP